ncbi:MAG: ATP-dependent DNA helicase [Acidiferrobacterales bacterium]
MPVESLSAEILGAGGPLAASLNGFVVRPQQQEMAASIEQAMVEHARYIVESGTGTGKTVAYLVPALLSGKKVLISTGTRNLQDQLYRRDLPLVREALANPVSTALLKGRANYLCIERLERAELEGRFTSRNPDTNLGRIREWAGRTESGDIAELSDVPEDSELWPLVTSTSDNCLGSQCRHYGDCHVNRARREALAADVLVVNHHLFFADLVLREEGFGQILPGVEVLIFDEAHQLADIASNFFGISLSSNQLNALCRDVVSEELKEKSAVAGLRESAQKLEKVVADMRLAFGGEVQRAPWSAIEKHKPLLAGMDGMRTRLSELSALLETAATHGPGLASCLRRALDLLDRLILLGETPPADHVPWFETGARSFVLHLTPMDIATPFRQYLDDAGKAWIFTSATLAIDHSFEHFQTQLGLEEAQTGQWDSPFDYSRQALLYIPTDLPSPSAPDYTQQVLEAALPVLEASAGRAFILFTSHRALKFAADFLGSRSNFRLLIQGSAPRAVLLDRFRSAANAVLLGTGSFWEGVDVRGEALSTVIIDKLPFAAPDDPVLRARGEAMERAGRNPFMEYQLPNAVIALKQGAGRLIRDVTDRGVLMLCDPRLMSKGYGRIFLSSLPPIPRTRELEDVKAFFGSGEGQVTRAQAARASEL